MNLRHVGLSCLVFTLLLVSAAILAGRTAKPQTQSAAAVTDQPTPPAVTVLTDTGWPRDVVTGATKITIYQPQIDSWDGFHLTARSAVAVAQKADAPLTYGIIQISADAHIDKDERLVSLEKITIMAASFPATEGEKGRQWASAIEARASSMRPLALERFEAAVAVSGQAAIHGPGGHTTTAGAIKAENAGALRVGDDLYAGHDGNVYKRNEGGGWDSVTRPQPRQGSQRRAADRRRLDRESAGRAIGNARYGAARSGG